MYGARPPQGPAPAPAARRDFPRCQQGRQEPAALCPSPTLSSPASLLFFQEPPPRLPLSSRFCSAISGINQGRTRAHTQSRICYKSSADGGGSDEAGAAAGVAESGVSLTLSLFSVSPLPPLHPQISIVSPPPPPHPRPRSRFSAHLWAAPPARGRVGGAEEALKNHGPPPAPPHTIIEFIITAVLPTWGRGIDLRSGRWLLAAGCWSLA